MTSLWPHPENKIFKMDTILLLLLTVFGIFNSNCKKPEQKEEVALFQAQSVTVLDDKVAETSGLIYFDGYFWTINDSGNPNILYRIDPKSGLAVAEIRINNSKNVDWEDLTQDQDYIYIADIGDNSRNRDEKQIYRLKKTDVLTVKNGGAVDCDVIRFIYPEVNGQKISYDAEALISLNDELHLFTKDLFQSNHFTIPIVVGETTATFVEKFKSNGQLTGAALDPSSNTLVMVGYLGFGNRLFWEINNFGNTKLIGDALDPKSLGSLNETGQVEAVCFGSEKKIYFTNEKTAEVKQQLWKLP